MARVFLVEPADLTIGKSLITPAGIAVLDNATPRELVGEPILVDEAIRRFDAKELGVGPGDIVGISIKTNNCLAGYRVAEEAKRCRATVVMGGIHATIRPQEALAHGANAVVKRNGDLIWSQVVKDGLAGRLLPIYDGGLVPGKELLSGNWSRFNPDDYLFPSVRTVTGCIEDCGFCSVWVVDGRIQRLRPAQDVAREVKVLLAMGFPAILFADDNFFAAPLGRIEREKRLLEKKRREGLSEDKFRILIERIGTFEKLRADRLRFLEEYVAEFDGNPPPSFVQITAEAATDPECLRAMRKAGVRVGLVGFESPDEASLKLAGKAWNPVGQGIVEIVQAIQAHGIHVFGSFISGLASDTPETVGKVGKFAVESGMFLAQFTAYWPLPGTRDFSKMLAEKRENQSIQLVSPDYWLDPEKPRVPIRHPNLTPEDLLRGIQENWGTFYGFRESVQRAGKIKQPAIKTAYVLGCLGFKAAFIRKGTVVRPKRKRSTLVPRLLLSAAIRLHHARPPRNT